MADEKLWLCRGSGPQRGKYRGVLARKGRMSAEGRSVFWGKQQIEVILPESAVRECEKDPEIVIVKIREVTAEEAEAHPQGPVAAQAGIDVSAASTDQLRAELLRRERTTAGAPSPEPKRRPRDFKAE